MKKIFQKYFTKSTFKIAPSYLSISVRDKSLAGLKILHISDLHIDEKTSKNEIIYLIDTLNNLNCDILVLTGDLIDCKTKKIEEKLLLLKDIKHKVYFVSGNHDLVYGYETLKTILNQCKITILDNCFEYLEYKNTKYILAGLSDRFSKFFKIKRDETIFVEKLKDIKKPKIFIAHQPKDYIYALNTKSELFLCGHTHAGQIYPFGYLVRLVQPFLKGLHYKNNLAIYVNSGLGAWGLKYRFLSKPEITIIEVK